MRFHQPVRFLLISSLLLASVASHAVTPGKYETKGQWGSLTISKKGTFKIETIGGLSSCDLEGKVNGDQGFTGGETPEQQCELQFIPKGKSILLQGNNACRYYCGASAELNGLYLPVLPKKKK